MDKCEKLWQPDGEALQRSALQGEVYSIGGTHATLKMRACSGCAGDYEDPDRTAWTSEDDEENGPGSAPPETTEEFPAGGR